MSHEFDDESYIGCNCEQCIRIRDKWEKKDAAKKSTAYGSANWKDHYDTGEDCPHCLDATAKTIFIDLQMMERRALQAEECVKRLSDELKEQTVNHCQLCVCCGASDPVFCGDCREAERKIMARIHTPDKKTSDQHGEGCDCCKCDDPQLHKLRNCSVCKPSWVCPHTTECISANECLYNHPVIVNFDGPFGAGF